MSNPHSILILPQAERVATVNAPQDGVYSRRPTTPQRGHIIFDVAAAPAGQTLTARVQAEDFFGNWYDVLVSEPINSTGRYVFKIGPEFPAVPNLSASDMLPDVWRVRVEHSGNGVWAYGLSANVQNG